jgi:hypothetical protein
MISATDSMRFSFSLERTAHQVKTQMLHLATALIFTTPERSTKTGFWNAAGSLSA